MKKSAQSRFNRDQVQTKGFTLVELLVVIAIIAILAAVVVLILNPIEISARGRDAARMIDLNNIRSAIDVAVSESTGSGTVSVLCKVSGTYPCNGSSHTSGRLPDGSGWVKTDISSQKSVSVPTLPVDQINDTAYHYTYCANNDAYEIDAVLESEKEKGKMTGDGGNENDRFEVGSNLALIAASGGSCTY